MTFDELRQKHPEFVYENLYYEFVDGGVKVIFHFSIAPDIHFHPEVFFPNVNEKRFLTLEQDESLYNLLFHLGMIEAISYWKATCSPKIVIKTSYLDDEMLNWWKGLYLKGLGEFFYLNKIDFTKEDLLQFEVSSDRELIKNWEGLNDRDLVMIGGGKDSAVTLDIISKSEREFACFQLNPTQASKDVVEASGCKGSIIVKRTIHPRLLELNKEGYLNGHTPFSAYLAFLGIVASVLYDYRNIIVSNESSASEATLEWIDHKINHQYSKSLEFEDTFRSYSKEHLSENSNYFSFLRPLNELRIAELFSKMSKYHKVFRSCNKGSKENIWCGECSKCLFAYAILYPYLAEKTNDIFGKDIYQDLGLLPTALQLIKADDNEKPFECVGMADESKAAFYLSLKKVKAENKEIPPLLQELSKYITEQSFVKDEFGQHNISEPFLTHLKKELKNES